jgi:hypothetical protein
MSHPTNRMRSAVKVRADDRLGTQSDRVLSQLWILSLNVFESALHMLFLCLALPFAVTDILKTTAFELSCIIFGLAPCATYPPCASAVVVVGGETGASRGAALP